MIGVSAFGDAGYQAGLAHRKKMDLIREKATNLSTDFIEGYVQSYKSSRGVVYQFLTKLGLDIESSEIAIYKSELKNRKSLSDKV